MPPPYDAYDAWTGNHRYVRARDTLIQTTRHMRHRGFQPHMERNEVIALAVPARDLLGLSICEGITLALTVAASGIREGAQT
jgi:hypothetical protein